MSTRTRNAILEEGFPVGVTSGTRAITTRSYTEANSKLGVEHEGSTLFTAASLSTNDTFL